MHSAAKTSPTSRDSESRAAGHDVFTPTLTGRGEWAHLFNLGSGRITQWEAIASSAPEGQGPS